MSIETICALILVLAFVLSAAGIPQVGIPIGVAGIAMLSFKKKLQIQGDKLVNNLIIRKPLFS